MSYITKLCEEKGLTLVDGDEHVEIEITAADIKAARRKDATCCAFAVACRRTEKAVAAYFFKSLAFIQYKDKTLVRYIIPGSVQKEIVSFDRSGAMDPGHYRLSPFTRKKRSKDKRERHDENEGKGRKRKRVRHVTENIRVALGSYRQ